MTFALARESRSIILACTSRGHGQRPMLAMLVSSIAITAMRSEGAREDACTPMSYALRSRLCSRSLEPAKSMSNATTEPRNQSVFQNLDVKDERSQAADCLTLTLLAEL